MMGECAEYSGLTAGDSEQRDTVTYLCADAGSKVPRI